MIRKNTNKSEIETFIDRSFRIVTKLNIPINGFRNSLFHKSNPAEKRFIFH